MSDLDLTAVVPIQRIDNSTIGLKNNILSALELGVKVILVINGSTSIESSDIRFLFEDVKDRNFQYLEGNGNSPGLARNLGLRECATAYITFWDADDYPQIPNICKLFRNLFDDQTKNFALGSFLVVTPNLDVKESFILSDDTDIIRSIVKNPGIWRWIFRTQRIRETAFKEFMMGEDQDFISDLNPQENEMIFSSEVTYKYVKGWKNQLTGSKKNLNHLEYSMAYLFEKINRNTANMWHRYFLERQILTALKRGSLKLKISALRYLINMFFYQRS